MFVRPILTMLATLLFVANCAAPLLPHWLHSTHPSPYGAARPAVGHSEPHIHIQPPYGAARLQSAVGHSEPPLHLLPPYGVARPVRSAVGHSEPHKHFSHILPKTPICTSPVRAPASYEFPVHTLLLPHPRGILFMYCTMLHLVSTHFLVIRSRFRCLQGFVRKNVFNALYVRLLTLRYINGLVPIRKAMFRYITRNLPPPIPPGLYLSPFTTPSHVVAGGRPKTMPGHIFRNFDSTPDPDPSSTIYSKPYLFLAHHVVYEDAPLPILPPTSRVCKMPLGELIPYVPRNIVTEIFFLHGISTRRGMRLDDLTKLASNHHCKLCDVCVFEFRSWAPINNQTRCANWRSKPTDNKLTDNPAIVSRAAEMFPPPLPSPDLVEKCVAGFCADSSPSEFEEAGCMVCGQLTRARTLVSPRVLKENISLIDNPSVTRKERSADNAPREFLKGPVVATGCTKVCPSCVKTISDGTLPDNALASGLWLGDVPPELSDLRFAERLLVSRVRHNCCVGRIATGGRKLMSNAVMFASPLPKVYDMLPPPKEDVNDILAVIFVGPCQPTNEELNRSPFLVRRRYVRRALEWLRLNHHDYFDVGIDERALAGYPDNDIPVSVEYHKGDASSNKIPEGTSVHEHNGEEGTSKGSCPFVVHGLSERSYESMRMDALKTEALRYLNSNGEMLAVGHSEHKESIYDNPHLYPQMFPWLFPYGLGGIGSVSLGDVAHVRHLLLYHDKRFQRDPEFPLIAFNHQQIKSSTTGSHLFVKNKNFDTVKRRLLSLDPEVLRSLSERMSEPGAIVHPETEAEKACFQILTDMDIFGGMLDGSITSKKHMRGEIWAMMAHLGAPSWYITISPADIKHPLCVYYADDHQTFYPNLHSAEERVRLVTKNPVAGARFFNFMMEAFIKHVLGVGSKHSGFYGPTAGYYGTVEQQGRLTLHMHLLLWIKGCISPSEIRDRLNDADGEFQKALISYLETCHSGDYGSSTAADVADQIEVDSSLPGYQDPTFTMPVPPPKKCNISCQSCTACSANTRWWHMFRHTTNDVLSRSNVHTCRPKKDATQEEKKGKIWGSCMTIWGTCKARFPRSLFSKSTVDEDTGHINLKKGESMMNTFTFLISYLFRCNHDVTCLLSGTAIKAVIAYVTDYVTKPSLKTHVVFSTICSVFERNKDMIHGDLDQNEKARRVMNKVVNSVAARMEIGAPMACAYLLGHPDHYTGHTFQTYSWKQFIHEARKPFEESAEEHETDVVGLRTWNGNIFGVSPVHDYVQRPQEYEDMTLYTWLRLSRKIRSKSKDQVREEEESKRVSLDDIEADAGNDAGEQEAVEDDGEENIANAHVPLPDEDVPYTTNAIYNPTRQRKIAKAFKYLPAHPLHGTHKVYCVPESDTIVLNLVGGALPRFDRGDREYYCSTMLALFSTWRSGKDLKPVDGSWNDAFEAFQFTERQKELMKNFNIQYECLDARDNHSAEMKKGRSPVVVTHWSDNDTLTAMDDELATQRAFQSITDAGEEDLYAQNGSTSFNQFRETAEVCARLDRAGWSDPDVTSVVVPQSDNTPPSFKPKDLDAAQWKANVDKAKAAETARRQRHLAERRKTTESDQLSQYYTSDYVKVVTYSHLDKDFKARRKEYQEISEKLVKVNGLNKEQERAYRIIVNHSNAIGKPPALLMYIGGMGGTGKSRVLKTVIENFEQKKERYRIMVVAPTGSAAALVGGCTYHSLLGINEGGRDDFRTIAQVRERLAGVDYIFFDEVSMLSTRDLYKIHARLALALGNTEEPFGGINLIFAGDFAQLPPVMGGEAVSLYGNAKEGSTVATQEAALGKALWHQVTNVVMLRENMRQRTQTEADSKLRNSLENMRYKACTPDNLAFLNTRKAGTPNGPDLQSERFKHQSVITRFNLHKDEINRQGGVRFAKLKNKKMYSFYSIDELAPSRQVSSCRGRKKIVVRPATLTPALQNHLWNRPTSSSEKLVAGRLDLCEGMPIMIRRNVQTELCITNGQEGTVAGWKATVVNGKRVLDVLFVRLVNPPQDVQIDDLPLNVVPIMRTKVSTDFSLPSGYTIHITRDQVEVLPNFAMTDFASQGKTREINIVDLSRCLTHQSYYTCLSRSASAKDTVIIGVINASIITGQASGWLRQEFRHLEILADITEMRYEKQLPESLNQLARRKSLVAEYQRLKGAAYVPKAVHPCLSWAKEDPDKQDLSSNMDDIPDSHIFKSPRELWKKNQEKEAADIEKKALVAEEKINKRRKALEEAREKKRLKPDPNMSPSSGTTSGTSVSSPTVLQPMCINNAGPTWDPVNYSCAYDSVLTILLAIFKDDTTKWSHVLPTLNPMYLGLIAGRFQQALAGRIGLNAVRDELRSLLFMKSPLLYPRGVEGASVTQLLLDLFAGPTTWVTNGTQCAACTFIPWAPTFTPCTTMYAYHGTPKQVDLWMRRIETPLATPCPMCRGPLVQESRFMYAPPVITLDLQLQGHHMTISQDFQIDVAGIRRRYRLAGIIYYGESHFTSRIVHPNKSVWFYDGQNGPNAVFEGWTTTLDLKIKGDRVALCLVYV